MLRCFSVLFFVFRRLGGFRGEFTKREKSKATQNTPSESNACLSDLMKSLYALFSSIQLLALKFEKYRRRKLDHFPVRKLLLVVLFAAFVIFTNLKTEWLHFHTSHVESSAFNFDFGFDPISQPATLEYYSLIYHKFTANSSFIINAEADVIEDGSGELIVYHHPQVVGEGLCNLEKYPMSVVHNNCSSHLQLFSLHEFILRFGPCFRTLFLDLKLTRSKLTQQVLDHLQRVWRVIVAHSFEKRAVFCIYHSCLLSANDKLLLTRLSTFLSDNHIRFGIKAYPQTYEEALQIIQSADSSFHSIGIEAWYFELEKVTARLCSQTLKQWNIAGMPWTL